MGFTRFRATVSMEGGPGYSENNQSQATMIQPVLTKHSKGGFTTLAG